MSQMSKKKSWFNNWCKKFQKGDNDYNEGRLYNKFSLLAMNRFKWENLPPGVESRHIEKYLYEHGQVAFFNDELNDFMVLPCSDGGNLNYHGEPLNFNVVGIGFNKTLESDKMVRIMCNDTCTPNKLEVLHYTRLIDEIEKTSFMNLRQQRFPWIIATTKENELTMKNIFEKIENFEESIVVDSRLTQGGALGINALETKTPYILDKIRQEKNEVINELLSWLGLNNTKNKAERLLVDEINVNNNHILMNLDIEFKNRQKACEEINQKYGLNIKVVKTIDELDVNFMGQLDGKPSEPNDNNNKKGWFK